MDTLATGTQVQEATWTMWEILKAGGWYIMVPLLLLSVGAVYVFLERLVFFRKWCKYRPDFFATIYELIKERDYEAVLKLCRKEDTVYSSIVGKTLSMALENGNGKGGVLEALMEYETARLEKNLSILGSISVLAPMLGFLGTVIGMVIIMQRIASEGGFVDISLLAEGLFQALITTVAGLLVGIPASAFKGYLVARIEDVSIKMKGIVSEILKSVNEQKSIAG